MKGELLQSKATVSVDVIGSQVRLSGSRLTFCFLYSHKNYTQVMPVFVII